MCFHWTGSIFTGRHSFPRLSSVIRLIFSRNGTAPQTNFQPAEPLSTRTAIRFLPFFTGKLKM